MNKAKQGRKTQQTPILNSLIIKGLVKWEANAHQYIGRASDGVLVNLGYNSALAERYLSAHPCPELW
jgi:hypothetical protein